MTTRKHFWIVFVALICFLHQAYSQPYYFYHGSSDSTKFWRFNLQNGAQNVFHSDTVNPYGYVYWDPTQQWVFIQSDNSYLGKWFYEHADEHYYSINAVNAHNSTITHLFPDQHPHPPGTSTNSFFYSGVTDRRQVVDGIVFNPIKNALCVSWLLPHPDSLLSWTVLSQYQRTAVYDASSFTVIDTLPVLPGWINSLSSVSDDGNYLYVEKCDFYKNKAPSVGKYSLLTNQLVINKKLSDISVPGGYAVSDSKKGYYLIAFLYPRQQMEDTKYGIYNIDKDSVYGLIPFPLSSFGYLSSDGKYIIIEETPWTLPNYQYTHPGRISIFDGFSSKLIQKLTLPSDGKVLVFDNYPNMLYYYLPAERRSINIDLSRLANITSLSPAFAYGGSNAFTLTVSGKNFANGSTVNWGGVAKTTTFIADTLLQASILASDIAVIDSPLVTVKNADGSAESNGVRLYIKQPPPITGCNVKLVNSTGAKLTGGALQYYEGSWKDAVNNNDGTFFVSTSAKTISLRMTYEYGTQTKSNVTVGPDTVVFQTVKAQTKLQDSKASSIDTGTIQYYAGAWRSLGTTISGIASKELLPGNYSFRMTYAYASKDKQQDVGTNPTVVFETVNAKVQLRNSQGNLIDQGTVQYYSGAWRDFGVTTNGVATKELLPNNYSFRMAYAFASKEKQQDISANLTVVFQTVDATVQLQTSQGSLIDQGTVQYYSGAWRDFGVTTNGVAAKELLPNSYSFRMTYAYASKDKQQDIGANATVVFQTVNAAVQLQNSQGALMDQGTVQYYSGAWRGFGTTTNGVANKELLPNNYSFRMTYAYASKDKQQDLSTNPTVVFQTVKAIVQLQNSQGALIDQGTVQYYSGAWRDFGTTRNGTASKELLPNNYSFRMTYEYVSLDKTQDLSTNSTVNFSTVLCTIRVKNSQSQPVDGALASYYSGAWRQIGTTVNGEVTKELLPATLTFRVTYGTTQQDKTQNLSTNNVIEFAIGL